MIVVGLVIFGVAGAALAWIEDRIHRHTHSALIAAWAEYFALPLGRSFALMILIGASYPDLFGTSAAPPLFELLSAHKGGLDRMITVLFLTGLALPSLPVLRRMPGLTLPLQGMAGVALLFSWLAGAMQIDATWIPGTAQLLLLVILSGLGVIAARLLALCVKEPVVRQDLHDLLLLWLQAPLILIYARMLGSQLS